VLLKSGGATPMIVNRKPLSVGVCPIADTSDPNSRAQTVADHRNHVAAERLVLVRSEEAPANGPVECR
jgi:hypothetical protein